MAKKSKLRKDLTILADKCIEIRNENAEIKVDNQGFAERNVRLEIAISTERGQYSELLRRYQLLFEATAPAPAIQFNVHHTHYNTTTEVTGEVIDADPV